MEKENVTGIIGSGTMGSGIAQAIAMAQRQVILYDTNRDALARAKNEISAGLENLLQKGKINAVQKEDALGRIRFVSETASFKTCSLVIEAIVENLAAKQSVFRTLEKVISPGCVLATNTSSLSVTAIASVCEIPGRVIGMHFFNPAHLMPLVEIVPGLNTDSGLSLRIKQMVHELGKVPVIAKDTPGFIVNRLARPFYGEAIRILEEQIADIATIDWAMKDAGGFRMGPFELMDLIGNDINYTVTETVWRELFCDPRYTPSLTQKRLVEAKRFGRKSGQGYYDYSPGAEMPMPLKDKQTGEKIFMRILSMLVNEAADALYLGIASKEDIDLAMTRGVNYPKGLLRWADEIGAEKILDVLSSLREEYAESRYRPSVLLKKMVSAGAKFYL